MTVRVCDLKPGDRLKAFYDSGIVIGTIDPHPLYPKLWMVIWWLEKERRFSIDALNPRQELPGELQENPPREENLRTALHHT
jgi:hypothetical protein